MFRNEKADVSVLHVPRHCVGPLMLIKPGLQTQASIVAACFPAVCVFIGQGIQLLDASILYVLTGQAEKQNKKHLNLQLQVTYTSE